MHCVIIFLLMLFGYMKGRCTKLELISDNVVLIGVFLLIFALLLAKFNKKK